MMDATLINNNNYISVLDYNYISVLDYRFTCKHCEHEIKGKKQEYFDVAASSLIVENGLNVQVAFKFGNEYLSLL